MTEHFDCIIIGAGFSGIGAARELFKVTNSKSFTLAVLEKTSDIGGVWHANQYPNAGCDVFSHLYSFSWFLNPNWTKQYSKHDEIKQYLINAVDKLGLHEHIKFNHAVTSLKWNEELKQWHVGVLRGDQVTEMTCTFVSFHSSSVSFLILDHPSNRTTERTFISEYSRHGQLQRKDHTYCPVA